MNPLLNVQNLETWYGPIIAMQGVNITVEKGQIVAVLGANGAGKTTLLNTLAGVVDPFKGTISFNQEVVSCLDADEVCRKGMVLVPEGRQVFPFLSVKDNLRMGAFTRNNTDEVAHDLEQVYQWFPSLRERQQQLAGLLSGGEQQMLGIGRAYMSKPKLLMLDEPSLGISPLLTKEIFNIIVRIRDETKTAILVVEQNAAIALAHADYGYIMELGCIVAADTCAQLSQKADVQQAYLGGHSTSGLSGTAQRWKKRKTWR
ncbi:MAG: ABC transporter ATP-binding protein [Limnohabitans sp.]|nr:ABC transporter ATP-binding protein [Limnohabitans sp.]